MTLMNEPTYLTLFLSRLTSVTVVAAICATVRWQEFRVVQFLTALNRISFQSKTSVTLRRSCSLDC